MSKSILLSATVAAGAMRSDHIRQTLADQPPALGRQCPRSRRTARVVRALAAMSKLGIVGVTAAGCGVDKFQNTNGRLLGHLASAGYAPGDIDMILFTHCHFDHLWGISDGKNASLLFPSAEFVASETEVKFWNAPELTANVSPALKPEVTRANLKLASPRLRLIKAGTEVAPGVTTIDTAGHTPGHMSVHISSGSEELLLTADAVVNSTVSFQHPEWPFGFDQDVPLAAKARIAFLDRAATDKTLVGGYHFPFPGFGHVAREGSSYRWLPADWQWTS